MREGWRTNVGCLSAKKAGVWLAALGIAWGIGSGAAASTFLTDAEAKVAFAEVKLWGADSEKTKPSKVVARIDLSDQIMYVYVNAQLAHRFTVSTGLGRYRTPRGLWQAKWLSPHHRSRKYHNAPMPWSVFFYGGYAVHGTTEVSNLGRPASHGCVRLHPDNAKIFYKLVKDAGMDKTLIAVVQ